MIAATIALRALGALVRDGTPSLGATHGARALGGFFCVLGGFLGTWEGALLRLKTLTDPGKYIDMSYYEKATKGTK